MDRTADRFPLAHHAWKAGQLLTSAHFERQQDVLQAHLAARVRLCTPRAHGIVSLQLDPGKLRVGLVVVERLVWLREDGILVATGENAHLPAPLEIEGNGRTSVMLYVGIEGESDDGFEGTAIVPRIFRLDLEPVGVTTERTLRADESCLLLELVRGKDGKELVLDDFVPPLLRVGDSPYLQKLLHNLEHSVREFNRGLLNQAHATTSVQDRASDIQRRYAAGQKVLALFREAGLSAATQAEAAATLAARVPRFPVYLHPYQLFCALRDYACELAAVPGSSIDPETLVYEHDHLKQCYQRLNSAIMSATPSRVHTPHGLEFEREGRIFILRQLPREVLDGRNVVLALNGAEDISGLKLASPSRLSRLHAALLPGLQLEEHKIQHAPVGGVQTRYFRVSCVARSGNTYRVNALWRFSAFRVRASKRHCCGGPNMGLLEALTGGASGPRTRSAVTRHLNHLLRSTCSFGSFRSDFGVPIDALLGGTMAESDERLPVERLRLVILRAVRDFEPGVVEPELLVCFQDNHGNLHFELRGQLQDGSGFGAWHVRFSTRCRQVDVQEIV